MFNADDIREIGPVPEHLKKMTLPGAVEVSRDSMGERPLQVTRRIGEGSKIRFSFQGADKIHQIEVDIDTGADGTLGIRVVGLDGQLIVQPKSARETYITTLRPDRMPRKA